MVLDLVTFSWYFEKYKLRIWYNVDWRKKKVEALAEDL